MASIHIEIDFIRTGGIVVLIEVKRRQYGGAVGTCPKNLVCCSAKENAMSRGFVKEEDQEEAPMVPPRAALPEGITNYVTPTGYRALQEEKKLLKEEQKNLPHENETERRRASMAIDGKLKLLNQRIRSARVLDLQKQPQDEVRFGAVVQFKNAGGIQRFQLVGVDEADIQQHKIAFIAPIARALIGKKVGDTAEFKRGNEVQKLEILHINYPD